MSVLSFTQSRNKEASLWVSWVTPPALGPNLFHSRQAHQHLSARMDMPHNRLWVGWRTVIHTPIKWGWDPQHPFCHQLHIKLSAPRAGSSAWHPPLPTPPKVTSRKPMKLQRHLHTNYLKVTWEFIHMIDMKLHVLHSYFQSNLDKHWQWTNEAGITIMKFTTISKQPWQPHLRSLSEGLSRDS